MRRNYHKDAELKIQATLVKIDKQLRSECQKCARQRQHNEIQVIDVNRAIDMIFNGTARSKKKDIAQLLGPLLVGIGIPLFIDALPNTLPNGQVAVDTVGLIIWGITVLTGSVTTTFGIITS